MICSAMEVKQMSVEINRDPLRGNFKIRMQRFGHAATGHFERRQL